MMIYTFLASTIAQHFFPKQDKLTGIASVFAIFFVGYLARPLGALFFGRIGDKLGRKPALITSIGLMAVSTCGIGLIPDYATIGGPILLLLNLRLLQGFSCGGEVIGSIIFVVEHAPRANRGFYAGFTDAGGYLGLLFASLVSWLIQRSFSPSAVNNWAWRLPFLLGLVVGLVGWFMRRRVPETQIFLESIRMPKSYLRLYREYANQIPNALTIIGLMLFGTVLLYLVYVFSITYMTSVLHYTQQQALSINIVSIILLILSEPWLGKLSDKIGRRPLMAFALMGSIIGIWPFFFLLQQQSVAIALLAKLVITIFATAYFAALGVTIVEIVPVHLRFSVVTFSNAIAISLFGGITPFIATILIKVTHSYFSIAAYIVVCALISLIAVYKVRETKYIS